MKFSDIGLIPTCVLFVTAGSAHAQIGGTLVSPPKAVNKTAFTDVGADFAPALVSNGGEVWFCAFTTSDPTLSNGGDTDIFTTRSRDLGLTWSVPNPVASFFATDAGATAVDFEPDLATDGGNRVVVWSSTRSSAAGHHGIFAAFGGMSDTLWFNAQAVNTGFATDSVDDREPTVAGSAGVFVAVWQRPDTSGEQDLFFSRMDLSNGFVWSTPARLNTNGATDSGTDVHPKIVTNGQGAWIVVFESQENMLGAGTDPDIFACRSLDNGLTWSLPILVNSSATSDGSAVDSEPSISVDVATGTWLVAWRTAHTFGGTTGGDAEIAWSKSTNNGATWSAAALLNTDFATDPLTTVSDSQPSVGCDQLGRFIVSWTRRPGSGPDTDILGARTDNFGVTWTAPQLVDTNTALDIGTDSASRIAADGEGHWLTVWASTDSTTTLGPTDSDIHSSRFMIPQTNFSTDYCYGYVEVGNNSRCPCGNDTPITSHAGCANSSGVGAQLGMPAPLNASASNELITYVSTAPFAAVLVFQGDGVIDSGAGLAFGDGLNCVGGAIVRLGVSFANGGGNGSLTFAPSGVTAGSIRFYQAWYRDAASFCTSSTFNLSSAVGTVWQP